MSMHGSAQRSTEHTVTLRTALTTREGVSGTGLLGDSVSMDAGSVHYDSVSVDAGSVHYDSVSVGAGAVH